LIALPASESLLKVALNQGPREPYGPGTGWIQHWQLMCRMYTSNFEFRHDNSVTVRVVQPPMGPLASGFTSSDNPAAAAAVT
jgi:hypothetical protein